MSLQLQMIGTGNAFAKKYFNNNALLYADGYTLLIDCGITAPLALNAAGKSFADLDAVLITHLHADHVGGMEELAFQMIYLHQRKMKLYVPESLIRPLWENCLKAGMEDDAHTGLDDYFDVVTMRLGEPAAICPGLTIELFASRHIPGKDSYSLLFNGSYFYSADAVLDRGLIERLYRNGVRLFLHDCHLGGDPKVHATLDQLLTLPREIQERTWLMHYPDNREEYEGKTGPMRFVDQLVIYNLDEM